MRLAALLMAAMLAQSALAEDRSSPSETRHPAGWSGAYASAVGGLGFSSGRAVLDENSGSLIPVDVAYGLFPGSIKRNDSGGVIGIGAGYNVQSGAFVSGLELDLGYAATSAHADFSRIDNVPSSPFPGVSTNTRYETDFGFLATLRARAGYAFGDTLIFGTAGLAAGNVHNRLELALPEIGYTSPNWSGKGTRLGYALGLGIEQRFSRKISLKFETLYINLADRKVRGTDDVAFANEVLSYRFRNDLIVSRLGINFRF